MGLIFEAFDRRDTPLILGSGASDTSVGHPRSYVKVSGNTSEAAQKAIHYIRFYDGSGLTGVLPLKEATFSCDGRQSYGDTILHGNFPSGIRWRLRFPGYLNTASYGYEIGTLEISTDPDDNGPWITCNSNYHFIKGMPSAFPDQSFNTGADYLNLATERYREGMTEAPGGHPISIDGFIDEGADLADCWQIDLYQRSTDQVVFPVFKLLQSPANVVVRLNCLKDHANHPVSAQWKRVFVPCRAEEKLAKLPVRMFIPLASNQILLVLMERWSDIAGLAERIELDVATTTDSAGISHLEIGPDPTISVAAAGASPIPLSISIGPSTAADPSGEGVPFGHTHDTGSADPLFTASSYLITANNPPRLGVDPAWWLAKLRFRRRTWEELLTLPYSIYSDWTEASWVQFLPDSDQLHNAPSATQTIYWANTSGTSNWNASQNSAAVIIEKRRLG